MTEFVAVLPIIWRPYGDACWDSMGPHLQARTIRVHNDIHNIGVSDSWNIGIDHMEEDDADWLVLISAAVRFGPSGGTDFWRALDEPGLRVMEAKHLGWHLIAFHREVIERVGRFDTNLYPGWYNDLDYGWRIACAYGLEPPYWDKRPFDATDMGWSHSSQLAGVTCDADAMVAYMKRKWCHVPGHGPTWRHPYGDPALPVSFQPPHIDWEPDPVTRSQ